jgi:uncharacterized membrane-anchored protein YjiN (DUF445 family)
LGDFVETHFLPPDVINTKLESIDFADHVTRWLANPANAATLSEQITAIIPDFLQAIDDKDIRDFIRKKVTARLEEIEMAPLSGQILETLIANDRHQALLDETLKRSISLLMEKEPFIRQKIRNALHWIWQKLSLDEPAFNIIMKTVEDVLRDLEDDPDHELRQQFDRAVRTFIRNLKESSEYRNRADAIKQEVIHNPALQDALSSMWEEIKKRILSDIQEPHSETKSRLQAAIVRLGETLIATSNVRDSFNQWLRKLLADLIESHKHEISRLIPETVSTWDAKTMAERLELQVGTDLQFIRINGTLVGGMIGLLIYVVSVLAP